VITQVLHCPYCQGTDIVRHGTTPEGKQRYRCRECRLGRGRTFLLEYTYAGQSPEVKQQIVDMAQVTYGYSKDRRPDLKQFVLSTLCVDRAVPIWGKPEDGNASDRFCQLVDHPA
jgi:hypothetical protein